MVLVHTPRSIAAILRGLYQGRRAAAAATAATVTEVRGFGLQNPAHVYKSRAGWLDVDYLGHMNNAAFLSHAEYARWEMSAANGLLTAMLNSKTHFVVASSFVRYRQELRPIFRKFEVESRVAALDRRNIWILQNFVVTQKKKKTKGHTGDGDGDGTSKKLCAQLVVQGVAVDLKQRKPIDPRVFFREHVDAVSSEMVDELDIAATEGGASEGGGGGDDLTSSSTTTKLILDRYSALDQAMREMAALASEKKSK